MRDPCKGLRCQFLRQVIGLGMYASMEDQKLLQCIGQLGNFLTNLVHLWALTMHFPFRYAVSASDSQNAT